MSVMARTICLCCGSYYDTDGDCPQVRYRPHSIQIAVEVTRHLLEAGIEHPDKHDIEETLRELGYR